jgi:hypothetical protein
MVTFKQANDSVYNGLHVIIIFSFLTVFFFLIITKLTEKSINGVLSDVIDEQSTNILDSVDKWSTEIEYHHFNINWKNVHKVAKNIVTKSQGKLSEITANNKKLKITSICIITGLVILWILLILYMKYYQKQNIQISNIVLKNFVLFIFIGLAEYYFFTQIASKYIPVTPDYVSMSILERIKHKISEVLQK